MRNHRDRTLRVPLGLRHRLSEVQPLDALDFPVDPHRAAHDIRLFEAAALLAALRVRPPGCSQPAAETSSR